MGAPFNKISDFIFHKRPPPNGGPPLNRLIDEFATPVQDFFLRTHGEMPEFDSSTYRLTAGGEGKNPTPIFVPGFGASFFLKKKTPQIQYALHHPLGTRPIRPSPSQRPCVG